MIRLPLRSALIRAATWGLTFLVTAFVAIRYTRFEGGVAFIWLAGPVLFARLVTLPRRHWWLPVSLFTAANVVVTWSFGLGHLAAVPLAVINACEALAAAVILKRHCPRFEMFDTVGRTVPFLVVTGLAVPLASSFPAAMVAVSVHSDTFWSNWYNWFFGHALGYVTVAPPLILVLRHRAGSRVHVWSRRRIGEAALLFGAVLATAFAAFGQSRFPLLALPFVPALGTTLRLGRFGAIVSTFILVAIGIGFSLFGVGPVTLVRGDAGDRVHALQFYFGVVVNVLLPVAADLEARRRLLRRLSRAEAMQRLILDRMGDIVLRIGPSGSVHYVSAERHAVPGLDVAAAGQDPISLVHVDDRERVAHAFRVAAACPSDSVTIEYRVKVPNEERWVETTFRAIDPQSGIMLATRDVTGQRRRDDALRTAAFTDPLTGLGNRRAFDRALADGAAARGGCVAMFDIDHFKSVNDRFGHATGDRVLKTFATHLRRCTRGDDVVARLGGEEFAVILTGAGVMEASIVCERVRRAFEASSVRGQDDEIVRATVSVGVAVIADGGARDVLAAADAALYRAKAEGRNRLMLAA